MLKSGISLNLFLLNLLLFDNFSLIELSYHSLGHLPSLIYSGNTNTHENKHDIGDRGVLNNIVFSVNVGCLADVNQVEHPEENHENYGATVTEE